MADAGSPAPDAIARLAQAAGALAGAALVGMAGVEAWQVFARYVLNDSPGWTEPVALLLLNVAMSFGAALGVHQGAHFGFFILRESAPPALRRLLELVAQLLIALLGAVLAYWGAALFLDGRGVTMAGTWLPQSAPYLPMGLGGALMALFALDRARARWRATTPAPEH
jgi:TRAP-type C4-dicarboxylate transport system permease small subunit